MQARSLTGAEKATLYNALRHAAGIYRQDAATARASNLGTVAEHFDRQVKEADCLADLIEYECEDVELS